MTYKALALAAAWAVAVIGGPALAQQQPAKGKAAPAAQAQPAAQPKIDGAPPVAWIKLCDKIGVPKATKDGKAASEERSICLTHHERLDGGTGRIIVSAAVRQVEGQEKQHLIVMVPLGMAVQPGLKAAVYSTEQWDRMSRNLPIEEAGLEPVDLKFNVCQITGCTAEMELTPQLLQQMKTGGGLLVLAINSSSVPVAFPVPLTGFAAAYAGPPADNADYSKKRAEVLAQLRERAIEEARRQQAATSATGAGSGSAGTSGAGAAPAAPKKQ